MFDVFLVTGHVSLPWYVKVLFHTPIMQRSHNVAQMGCSKFTYLGALHSRLEHMCGTAAIAYTISSRLVHDKLISEKDAQIFVISSFLHDCAHPPFSHDVESILLNNDVLRACGVSNIADPKGQAGKQHDLLRYHVLKFFSEEFKQFSVSVEDVANFWMGNHFLSTLLIGPINVDILDYLNRDAIHSGAAYPSVNTTNRIINSISVLNSQVVFRDKSVVKDCLDLLQIRANAYMNIYTSDTALKMIAFLKHLINKHFEKVQLWTIKCLKNKNDFVLFTDAGLLDQMSDEDVISFSPANIGVLYQLQIAMVNDNELPIASSVHTVKIDRNGLSRLRGVCLKFSDGTMFFLDDSQTIPQIVTKCVVIV